MKLHFFVADEEDREPLEVEMEYVPRNGDIVYITSGIDLSLDGDFVVESVDCHLMWKIGRMYSGIPEVYIKRKPTAN